MIRDYLHLARQQPVFLLFGLLTACLSSFGQTFYIGLFSDDIRTGFGLSHGEYGMFYSLATLASGFTLLWAGRLVDRLDLRLITALTVLVLAVAAISMGLIGHALLLLPVLFLLRLAGQGMMGHIAVTAMGRYFAGSRGRAISVAAMGFPLGEAVFPAISISLVTAIGWQTTWQWAGSALLVIGLPMLMLLLRGHGRRHRAWQLRQRRLSRQHGDADRAQWPLRRVLRDTGFWGLMPVVLSPAFLVTGFFFHQGALASAKQWPIEWLAMAFILFATTQTTGLAVAGHLVDRTHAGRLLPFYLLPLAAAMAILFLLSSPIWVAAYMGLMGLTAGASATIVGAIWAERYGTRHLGAIRSVYTTCMIVSTAASPWLLGMLMDNGISLPQIAGTAMVWLVLVSLITYRVTRSRR
jgi:MFS family permease